MYIYILNLTMTHKSSSVFIFNKWYVLSFNWTWTILMFANLNLRVKYSIIKGLQKGLI